MSTAAGGLGGLITGLSTNPWTLPIGLGLGIFGKLFGNRQKTLPPPSPIFPGANQSYMQGLLGGGGQAGLGPTSMGGLTSLIQSGGMPTNYMPNVEAITQAMGRGEAEGRANLIEKFGVKGMRFSQPLTTAATDFELQNQMNRNQILSQYAFQSQESAAQRLMSALGMGTGLFGNAGMALYNSKTPPGPGVVSGISTGVGDVLQTISLMKMLGLHA